MSFVHGKSTSVYLGAVDLSTYLNSMDLSVTADQADTTNFHATWKSETLGTLNATVGFSGLFDVTDLTLDNAFASAVPGVLTYCPGGGAAIGDAARLVPAIDVARNISAPVGGMVAVSGSFDTSGVVGYGVVLHPLGEDTNNTTGATRTDAAATATGWTASLHVTVVDAGSWVIAIEDSANGTDWAALSGGAFTAATGATSQMLRGATAIADLRRYVRYTATRTGGSAGDGITFLLAYARN